MLNYAITALVGYLIGSFPTGVFITKRKYGIDVREMGSGNIGATNVTRVFGWYAGALVFIIDFLKGWGPLYLYSKYLPSEWVPNTFTGISLLGSSLVLGHCFSFFLRLKGGKGVATSFGCITFVAPWGALACAVVYLILLVTTKISAVGSLGGLFVALIYLLIMKPPPEVTLLISGICLVVLIRHHDNIKRLLQTYQTRKAGNIK